MPEYFKEDHECCVCLSTGYGRVQVEKEDRNTAICFGCIDKYMTMGLCYGMDRAVFSSPSCYRGNDICAMCRQQKIALIALPVCSGCQQEANNVASTVGDSTVVDSDTDDDLDWM